MQNYRMPITYWPPGTGDGAGGLGFGSPIVLNGRWEDRIEEFLDKNNTVVFSKANVFMSPKCGNTIEVGGYLFNGDQSLVTNPTNLSGAYEIRATSTVPDIRNVRSEFRAIL